MSGKKFSTDWMLGRADTGCGMCEGSGRIPVACPDNKPGCIVAHYKRCDCSKPAPTPQDAEAVARPDLTAETLNWLGAMRAVAPKMHEHFDAQMARIDHAAACVRFVAALDAGEIAQIISRRGLKNGSVTLWNEDDLCFSSVDALAAFRAAMQNHHT